MLTRPRVLSFGLFRVPTRRDVSGYVVMWVCVSGVLACRYAKTGSVLLVEMGCDEVGVGMSEWKGRRDGL